MRTAYAKTRYEAKKLYPWYAKIAKIEGGFIAFESKDTYINWKNQK